MGGDNTQIFISMTIFSNKLVTQLCRKNKSCGFLFSEASYLQGKPKSLKFIHNDQLSVLGSLVTLVKSGVNSSGEPEPSWASIFLKPCHWLGLWLREKSLPCLLPHFQTGNNNRSYACQVASLGNRLRAGIYHGGDVLRSDLWKGGEEQEQAEKEFTRNADRRTDLENPTGSCGVRMVFQQCPEFG